MSAAASTLLLPEDAPGADPRIQLLSSVASTLLDAQIGREKEHLTALHSPFRIAELKHTLVQAALNPAITRFEVTDLYKSMEPELVRLGCRALSSGSGWVFVDTTSPVNRSHLTKCALDMIGESRGVEYGSHDRAMATVIKRANELEEQYKKEKAAYEKQKGFVDALLAQQSALQTESLQEQVRAQEKKKQTERAALEAQIAALQLALKSL
jgi:hypothetical protein